MDHEGEDSGFSLYDHYGTGMEEDGGGGGDGDEGVAVVDAAAFPMHGWGDHHHISAEAGGAGERARVS